MQFLKDQYFSEQLTRISQCLLAKDVRFIFNSLPTPNYILLSIRTLPHDDVACVNMVQFILVTGKTLHRK